MYSNFCDLGGTLLEKKRYAYTAETDLSALTPEQAMPYAYGDAGWKDALTACKAWMFTCNHG